MIILVLSVLSYNTNNPIREKHILGIFFWDSFASLISIWNELKSDNTDWSKQQTGMTADRNDDWQRTAGSGWLHDGVNTGQVCSDRDCSSHDFNPLTQCGGNRERIGLSQSFDSGNHRHSNQDCD